MNNSAYMQVQMMSGIAHLFVSLVTLAIVIVGWQRHRQTGYLVLVAWCLAGMFLWFGGLLWMPMLRLLGARAGGIDPTMVMLVGNMISGLLASGLGCLGLGLIVFNSQRAS